VGETGCARLLAAVAALPSLGPLPSGQRVTGEMCETTFCRQEVTGSIPVGSTTELEGLVTRIEAHDQMRRRPIAVCSRADQCVSQAPSHIEAFEACR
jgi:hypothetical protein